MRILGIDVHLSLQGPDEAALDAAIEVHNEALDRIDELDSQETWTDEETIDWYEAHAAADGCLRIVESMAIIRDVEEDARPWYKKLW